MSTTLSPITSVNPATEEVLARFDSFTSEEVDRALDEAQDAFVAWRERSIADRAVPMRRLAALLRERADRYGRLITIEMGKPITEAKAEIEKCAWTCDHYAEQPRTTSNGRGSTTRPLVGASSCRGIPAGGLGERQFSS